MTGSGMLCLVIQQDMPFNMTCRHVTSHISTCQIRCRYGTTCRIAAIKAESLQARAKGTKTCTTSDNQQDQASNVHNLALATNRNIPRIEQYHGKPSKTGSKVCTTAGNQENQVPKYAQPLLSSRMRIAACGCLC